MMSMQHGQVPLPKQHTPLSRTMKNIIGILCAVVLCVCSGFTIYALARALGSSSSSNSAMSAQMPSDMGGMSGGDNAADGQGGNSAGGAGDSSSMQQPPDKPDGDNTGGADSSGSAGNSDSSGSADAGSGDTNSAQNGSDNGTDTTVPAKPSGEQNSQSSQDSQNSNDTSNSTSDETNQSDTNANSPDNAGSSNNAGNSSGDQNSGNTPPDLPSDNGNAGSSNSDSNGMSTPDASSHAMNDANASSAASTSSALATIRIPQLMYALLFVLESIVLALVITELIMTRMNKLALKQAWDMRGNVTITALTAVLLVIGLLVAQIGVTNVVADKLGGSATSAMQMGGGQGGQGDQSSNVSYTAATTIDSDTTLTSGTYDATSADEIALLVTGDIIADLSNITVNKTGDSDGGDSTSFYGINSALVAKSGADVTLKNITVTTDATGANGVFSYGGSATTNNTDQDGTKVTISDSKITTKQDASGGIMVTGGGVLNASNLTVQTAGVSSAAIRSDRGGGTLSVDGGTYTTTGAGSPAVYSTADITVKNATLDAQMSEGAVVEGSNSITLENTKLTDNNTKLNGESTTYKNVFLYQSMSGDAADNGGSTFSATGGSISTSHGDTFYVTNTTATINLNNVALTNTDTSGYLLRAQADSWGNSGSNGGQVTFNATDQTLTGNIAADSISTIAMTLKNSTFEGTINADQSAKEIKLTLDADSTFTLTGDSYVTSLDDANSSYSNIVTNGYHLYVNGKQVK